MTAPQWIDLIINPFWAILIGAYLTWTYFRQQNVLELYKQFYSELLDARSVVDTWAIHKTFEDFNNLYQEFSRKENSDEKGEDEKNRYYKTLQLAMFMQHLSAMHERKQFGVHFMVESGLFEDTFKPNVAAYYLKLTTFLNHRKHIQGKYHARFYRPFRDLALVYLEAYAREKVVGALPEANRSRKALIAYIDHDANRNLSSAITKQIADCPERGFMNLFFENYADQGKKTLNAG
jgi:hypothetical protein